MDLLQVSLSSGFVNVTRRCGSNKSAKLQKPSRVYYFLHVACLAMMKNKGAEQSPWIGTLVCAFLFVCGKFTMDTINIAEKIIL